MLMCMCVVGCVCRGEGRGVCVCMCVCFCIKQLTGRICVCFVSFCEVGECGDLQDLCAVSNWNPYMDSGFFISLPTILNRNLIYSSSCVLTKSFVLLNCP